MRRSELETICVVATRFPWPPVSGAERRLYHQIQMLRTKYNVVLVSESTSLGDSLEEDERSVADVVIKVGREGHFSRFGSALYSLGAPPLQVQLHYNHSLHKVLREVEAEYESVATFYSLIRTGPYTVGRTSAAILDYCDALSAQFENRTAHEPSPLKRRVYQLESKLVRRYERRVSRNCEAVLVTTPADQEKLPPGTIVIPNSFDSEEPVWRGVSKDKKVLLPPEAILFFGDMSTTYSELAATWFAREVFPLVLDKYPNASFWVVGRAPTARILELENDRNVHVTGSVSAISDYLNSCTIAVAPLLFGTGIKNKLLESFAARVPVVCTSVADDGMYAAEDKAVLVGDTPVEFADQVCSLLGSADRRSALGERGYQFANGKYGVDAVRRELLEAVGLARERWASR